jgi:hypothetical protein
MNSEGKRISPLGEFAPRCRIARVESPDEKAILVGNSMRAGEGSSPTRNKQVLLGRSWRTGKALFEGRRSRALCVRAVSGRRDVGRGVAVRAAVRLVERLVPSRWYLWRLVPGGWSRAREGASSKATDRDGCGWFLAVGGAGRRGRASARLSWISLRLQRGEKNKKPPKRPRDHRSEKASLEVTAWSSDGLRVSQPAGGTPGRSK